VDHAGALVLSFIGVVFVSTGVSKFAQGYARTLRVILGYGLLPSPAARTFALLLPWVELGLGLLLIINFPAGFWNLTAAGLLVLFSSAIALNILRGNRNIDCGCFGPESRGRLTWTMVVRNGGIILLLVVLGPQAPSPLVFSLRGVSEVFLGAAAVGGAWVARYSIASIRQQGPIRRRGELGLPGVLQVPAGRSPADPRLRSEWRMVSSSHPQSQADR
jgi:uncharacterized membrane protein YphA (DoxX/SURF4 family)